MITISGRPLISDQQSVPAASLVRGLILSDYDPMSSGLNHQTLDSLQYNTTILGDIDSELTLDEKVDRRARKVDLKLARDYMIKYGYMDRDSEGLKGKRLEMMLEPHLRLFQTNMGIEVTGKCLLHVDGRFPDS